VSIQRGGVMATSVDDQDGRSAREESPRAEGRDALLREEGVPLYLREIGAVALLTAAEEQALAVDRGREARRSTSCRSSP